MHNFGNHFAVHLKLKTTLLINYTPILKKKINHPEERIRLWPILISRKSFVYWGILKFLRHLCCLKTLPQCHGGLQTLVAAVLPLEELVTLWCLVTRSHLYLSNKLWTLRLKWAPRPAILSMLSHIPSDVTPPKTLERDRHTRYWNLPQASVPLANLTQSFIIEYHPQEYNSFQWVLQTQPTNCQMWRQLWNPQSLQPASASESSLLETVTHWNTENPEMIFLQ